MGLAMSYCENGPTSSAEASLGFVKLIGDESTIENTGPDS